MAKKHMKKMFTIPGYKGNAKQNTLRFHSPVRIVTFENTNNNCWRGCGEKGTLIHCWWESKLVQTLWKIVWRLLKKIKADLPHDPPIIYLLGTQRIVS
jgi:hypothetical protein